jgi:hypothetical protein
MHHLPGAVLEPAPEVMIHYLPWGKVMRQQSPGTAAAYNTMKIPWWISRLGYLSDRPSALAAGTKCLIKCRSRSLRSVG